MSTAKHTPQLGPKTYAPWFAWRDVNGTWQVGPSTNDAAASIWRDDRSERTAHLIAAAPELLSVLAEALEDERGVLGELGCYLGSEWKRRAETAIAKATGSAQ